MKLYLSGKITDFKFFKKKFTLARQQLENAGYVVCDPTTFELSEYISWSEAMKYDIRCMLQCDGVATMDNWRDSRGAKIEVQLARNMEMPVFSVKQWIARIAWGGGT
jgi:hypothetical protein